MTFIATLISTRTPCVGTSKPLGYCTGQFSMNGVTWERARAEVSTHIGAQCISCAICEGYCESHAIQACGECARESSAGHCSSCGVSWLYDCCCE